MQQRGRTYSFLEQFHLVNPTLRRQMLSILGYGEMRPALVIAAISALKYDKTAVRKILGPNHLPAVAVDK